MSENNFPLFWSYIMRIMAIQHRVKYGAESYPTVILIQSNDGKSSKLSMKTETDELDWLKHRFPVGYRKVNSPADLVDVNPRHIIWKEVKNSADTYNYPDELLKQEGKAWFLADQVPSAYEGIEPDDVILMILGGSGDNLAYAIARQAAKVGAQLYRVPAFCLPGEHEKNVDPLSLLNFFHSDMGKFYSIAPRDLAIIYLREAYRAWLEAMQARMCAEARLRQRFVGQVFRDEFGHDFEGSIEELFDRQKTNDAVLTALLCEEKVREKELVKTIEQVPIYQNLFKPITGVGPKIAARLIAAIIDIRRFDKASKLVKFCGVHVLPDGRFVRRRSGEVANWHNDARQALYLIGDQFNRRPNSCWGQELLKAKARLREIHPDVVVENGKKRFTPGHIHKMATWRTLTRFVEHLYAEWWRLEGGKIEKTIVA